MASSRRAGNVHAALRQADLLARPVPDLHQRARMAHEALSRRRQARSGLVAHEKPAPQLLFEGADPRADRGLCYV